MTDSPDSLDERAMLQLRLSRLLEATTTAADLPPGSWWVGDVAGERQVTDDRAAGRLSWREARRYARQGLAALDVGDLEMARTFAWFATDHFIIAILTRLRPSDLAVLQKPASRRGRPPKK